MKCEICGGTTDTVVEYWSHADDDNGWRMMLACRKCVEDVVGEVLSVPAIPPGGEAK